MAVTWDYTEEVSGDQVVVVALADGSAVIEIPVHVLKARMTGLPDAKAQVGMEPIVIRVEPETAEKLGRILRGER
jgi:hypothetical protein